MKIGIVSEYYYPVLGGISENVHNTYLQLKNRGFQVKIITSHSSGNGKKRGNEESDIIRVGWGVPVYSNGSFGRITVAGRLEQKARQILEEEKFDILHFHNPLTPILTTTFLSVSTSINIGTFHTYFDSVFAYKLFHSYFQKLFDKLDGKIAVSSSCVEAVGKYFPDNYRIIPNGVDTELFREDTNRIDRFQDGKKNILFVGRFDPRSGLKCMFEGFALVKKEFPESRLIVVGDGPLGRHYKNLVSDHLKDDVYFEGLVLEERPSYYVSSHVFCTPATKASFGVVLLEAMASGVPIVAADNCGYRNVMTENEGIFVPINNSNAFAEAILKLFKDERLSQYMGQNGREKALKFSWNKVTDQIVDFYREVSEGRGRKVHI